jgi:hypothetical protein
MIYNLDTGESSENDALPPGWKLNATERQYIYIKPPKIINSIAGIYIISSTGAVSYIGENRHSTVAQNGAQPNGNLLATSQVTQ